MIGAEDDGWCVTRAGIRRGALTVSFQRIVARAEPVARAPSSLGALPVAAVASGFIVPLAEETAFWIGIDAPSAPGASICIDARDVNGREYTVATGEYTGFSSVAGVACAGGGYRVFARSWLDRLRFRIAGRTADLTPVLPSVFAGLAGSPGPAGIEAVSGYGGWWLP